MFVHLSNSSQIKPKRDGIKVKRRCEKCGAESTFVECEKTQDIKLYGLIAIWGSSTVVMHCTNCFENFKVDTLNDPQLKEAFDARQKKAEAEAAAEAARRKAEEDKKKAEEERLRKAEELKREQEREEERKRKDAVVDKELEELKKKLGK